MAPQTLVIVLHLLVSSDGLPAGGQERELDEEATDSTIEQAWAVGRQFEEASDAAFAEGDALHGAQYFRWALLAFNQAQELAQR